MAMSNKQVVAIYIVGIVLLLGAFGAGLYVVKQDTSGQGAGQAAQAGQDGQSDPAARHVVHVASFGTAEEANKLTAELGRKYISAFTQSPRPVDQDKLYHVNIGPYDKRDADQVAEELRKEGRKGVMIKKWQNQ
jgi:cell division septation protein DedD